MKEGSFRYDLLARIGLWRFHLPPLRERPEDIAPNIEHELRNYVVKTDRKTQFSPEALRLYAFAGKRAAIPRQVENYTPTAANRRAEWTTPLG